MSNQERIAKVIARSGLCSRREAEQWVRSGCVELNGHVMTDVTRQVGESDRILVNGEVIHWNQDTRLWLYYKPKGVICTHSKTETRPILFTQLPPDMPRVVSIGRLDMGVEGLILLTNDGDLASRLERLSPDWIKEYRIQFRGQLQKAQIDLIQAKFPDYDCVYRQGLVVKSKKEFSRGFRDYLDQLGQPVTGIERTRFGPFSITDLLGTPLIEINADDDPDLI